ncbi:MAG: ATP-binding cassette domain-containing protein [Campylobacterota bacterium]|nr:ATP-binding cassette domain-containing protein [Campylobacterota bacterium]
MLSINSVSVHYKNKIALHPVSFSAYGGEILGFIGADGSAKSSLMHAIAGIVRFNGEIVYKGVTFKNQKESEKIKGDIGLMPQGIGLMLYDSLTIEEHLEFFSDIWGLKQNDEFETYKKRLIHMAGLERFQKRLAGNLSGGMRQKLSLVCTLLHKPKLLLLDEPTTGVDPLSRIELWEILHDIVKNENIICIVSTAYMDEAAKMNGVILFNDGKVIAQGKADELIDSMRSYTYEESKEILSDIISVAGFSYSLKPLKLPKKEPTLEALFFVDFLKQNRVLPTIDIKAKELNHNGDLPVMQAKNLTKRFDGFVANDSVSMVLKKGEIVGLLGPNGAGKTTFLKMLLGLIPIDEGELDLLGESIKSREDRRKLKGQIGYVSQHFSLYKKMTLRENLLYFAKMHQIKDEKTSYLIDEYATALGFKNYLDKFSTELPLGINQRLSVAAALMHEPVVLFLDEPTSGVDTVTRAVFWEIMYKLKTHWNISILITTHYMSEASYCDRVVLLKDGKKVADDTVEALYSTHSDAQTFEDIFMSYCRGPNGNGGVL